jgi:anti-sigma factor RsiW
MSEYVEEELEPDRRRRVEEHVEFCPRCRTVLANLRQTLVRLSSLGRSAPPGADDADQVAERLSRAWRERA